METNNSYPIERDGKELERSLLQWGFTRVFDARDGGPQSEDVRREARNASYDSLVLLQLPFGESAILFRGRDISIRRLAELFHWNELDELFDHVADVGYVH